MTREYRNYLLRRYGVGVASRMGTNALALVRPLLPPSLLRLERPVFIVGCSRAGTTLFAKIFGGHPDVASWMDASQVWDQHYYDKKADDYRDERHATAWETARLRAVFGLYTRMRAKERLVNKNNQNALRLRLLERVFPGCIIIHVMRDARPVVLSNVTRTKTDTHRRQFPFGRFPKPIRWREYVDQPLIEQFAHQWTDITQYVQTLGPELFGPSRYTEVRFEEFCAHPEFELARADAFCGLDGNRRDLSLVGAIRGNQSDRWRNVLTDDEVETIRAIAGPQMSRLGYSWD